MNYKGICQFKGYTPDHIISFKSFECSDQKIDFIGFMTWDVSGIWEVKGTAIKVASDYVANGIMAYKEETNEAEPGKLTITQLNANVETLQIKGNWEEKGTSYVFEGELTVEIDEKL